MTDRESCRPPASERGGVMKDWSEELIDCLEEFRNKLAVGERIMATTVTRCGCYCPQRIADDLMIYGNPACRLCNGRGFVFDAKTLFAASE